MKERVISAAIALLICIPLILLGDIYFNILVIVLGILAFKELLNLKKNIPIMMKYISYILFVVLLVYGYIFNGGLLIMNSTFLLICVMILFLSLIYYHKEKKYSVEDVFYLLGSIVLLSMVFHLFTVVRAKGLMLTLYLLLITTITDTFAYLVGSKIGKRKLISDVSPNKTVEGFVAGLVIGTIVPSLFYYFCVSDANILITILITFVLSIIGQCGDLVFSKIKRHYNIKDFSNIMPGHGGILDRLDSMIFVLIGYIIFSIIL